jgi:hypothetical protein
MEVTTQLSCPCRPNFFYKNINSFKAHKKTKTHANWELAETNKNDKILSKKFENEVERLRRRLAQKEEVESNLLVRINQLEHELAYFKKLADEVYL